MSTSYSSLAEIQEWPTDTMLAIGGGVAAIPIILCPVLLLKFLSIQFVFFQDLVAAILLCGIGGVGVYRYHENAIEAADYYVNVCGFAGGVLMLFVAEALLIGLGVVKLEPKKSSSPLFCCLKKRAEADAKVDTEMGITTSAPGAKNKEKFDKEKCGSACPLPLVDNEALKEGDGASSPVSPAVSPNGTTAEPPPASGSASSSGTNSPITQEAKDEGKLQKVDVVVV